MRIAPIILFSGCLAVALVALWYLHAGTATDDAPAEQVFDWHGAVYEGPSGEKAFKARIGDAWFVVADGEADPHFDEIKTVLYSVNDPTVAFRVFDADGSLVYAGRRNTDWFVVAGDNQFGPYDDVRFFASRADMSAFKAKRDGKWLVVVGGDEKKAHDWVGAPRISESGDVVYGARDGSSWHVVVNDTALPTPYRWVGLPAFSGDVFAVVVEDAAGMRLLNPHAASRPFHTLRGIGPEPGYRGILPTPVDGKLAVCGSNNGGAWVLVFSGGEMQPDTAGRCLHRDNEQASGGGNAPLAAALRTTAARMESRIDWFAEEVGGEQDGMRRQLASVRQDLHIFETAGNKESARRAVAALDALVDLLKQNGAASKTPCTGEGRGTHDTLCSIAGDVTSFIRQVQ